MARRKVGNVAYVVIAEYCPGEDSGGPGTHGCDGEYVDVIEVFTDPVTGAAAAEAHAAEVRDRGTYGDFGGAAEWSDHGWWISVRCANVTRGRRTA